MHVISRIGSLSIEKLTANIIRNIFAPFWHEKAYTARKALNHINISLKYAAVLGSDIDLQVCMKARPLLEKSCAKLANLPAISGQEVPAFYQSRKDDIFSKFSTEMTDFD